MQKILLGSLWLAGTGMPAIIQAAANDEAAKLAETVVTATRSETLTDQLAAASTVFTRNDIEKLQVRTLPELLKTAPGIDIVENGGYGKNTSLFMRGTNSDHVLVLIDGIKAGSVTLGTMAFQFIPIDQIERVEIIRGPQSSLYGSEAVGGVIQIFTRKGAQTETPSVSFDSGAGSYDTFSNAGNISGKWQNSWYSLGASHLNSQNINTRTGFDADRDAFYNTAIQARAGHRFDNNTEIEASFMRAFGKTEFDGMPNSTDFVNQMINTSLSFDAAKNWRSILRFGQTQDENDNFLARQVFFNRINTTRWNASWLNEISIHPDHQLTLGTDYRVDEVQSTEKYGETSRYDVGVFGNLHSRVLDNHFLNTSLRWDENEAFGNSVTGNIGWRFNWQYGLSAFASFGNAFKAPAFNDLYWPYSQESYFGTTYILAGNPNLRPEESTSFEAGIAGEQDWARWQLRAYHTDIDHLIDWSAQTPNPTTYIYQPANVNKAQIDGLEAELSSQWFGWSHRLNMSLLSPRDRTTNLRLARRSAQSLGYDLSRRFDAVEVGGHILAQGSRFDDRANLNEVAGFVTLDLRAAYHLNSHWMLSAKLNNLLDKDYQTADTYLNFGRNFFFTIHYNN